MKYLLPTLAVLPTQPPDRNIFENGDTGGKVLAALRARLSLLEMDCTPLYLAATTSIPDRFVKDMHRVLGFKGTPQVIDIYPLSKRVPRRTHAEPNARFLLFTDMVATGFTIDRSIMVLERQGYHVDVVLALADFRTNSTSRQTTEVFSGVPIHSIFQSPCASTPTEVDLSVAQLVDPGQKFSGQRPHYARSLLGEEEFLGYAIARAKTYALGHFEARPDRHQGAVVDVMGLARVEPAVLNAIQTVVGPLVSREDGSRSPITVLFPEDEMGNSAQLADLVAEQVRVLGAGQPDTIQLRRAHSDPGVILARDVPTRVGTAVLVDWGAVTTRTLRRAIALVADQGYDHLQVLLLTSQLPPEDLDDLARVARIRTAVNVPSMEPTLFEDLNGPLSEGYCDVTVSVVSTFPIPLNQLSDCWACAELAELHKLAESLPSSELRAHVERKIHSFETTPTSDIIARFDEARFFEAPLARSEVGLALKIRLRLLAASRNAESAGRLRLKVIALPAQSLEERNAWLRLLALEPDWLKLLPLGIPECRRALAEVSVACLDDPSTHEREQWLAAMVLRAASKRHFLEHFPAAVSRASHSAAKWEMLLGLYTLMVRPYNQRPELQREILEQVREALRLLTEGAEGREVLETLEVLGLLAESRARASESSHLTQAWATLKQDYYVRMNRHTRVHSQALIVDDAINGPASRRAAELGDDYLSHSDWATRLRAWNDCRRFILLHVLPHLAPIARAIAGFLRADDDWTPAADGGPLLMLYEVALRHLDGVSRELEGLSQGAVTFSESTRAHLAELFTPWYRAVLTPPSIDPKTGSVDGGALLYRALERMPADLARCWGTVVSRAHAFGWPVQHTSGHLPPRMMMCDEHLLTDALLHVVDNARKHRIVGQSGVVGIGVEYQEDGGRATVTVYSSDTAPSRRPGHGLAKYEGLLGHFAGSIRGEALNSDGWSYKTVLILQTWE